MTNILIIGATGTIGSAVTKILFDKTDINLTLFSRHATQKYRNSERVTVVDGDVLNNNDLYASLKNIDLVFSALSGPVDKMAQSILDGMKAVGCNRLIMISSMGIYNEIPASIHFGNLDSNSILVPYRRAADILEQSDLNYTIIRPGWFTDGPINYEITQKGESFGGHDVSVMSIADLVRRLVVDKTWSNRTSLGINTPNS